MVGFAGAFATASTFARGVLMARILGPQQFGMAIIILSVAAALEMFADAGIDRYVVQSRFGNRQDVMQTSHAFRVGGSTLIGLVIVALSGPLAHVFRASELWLPIALTGGIVIIRGLEDLSYKLQQRQHRFEQETIIEVVRWSADLAVTAAVALLTHSFWAVVAGCYANAIAQLIMTHALAKGRYSFWPRARLIALVGRFSLPIYINAFILFTAGQGDRMVVAGMFTKRDVALYAAACAIGQGISGLAGRITMSTFLPMMSKTAANLEGRRRTINYLGALTIAGSIVFLLGMALLGPLVVPLIYGPEYRGLQALIFASAIVQMIQLEQGWLTTLLMANGLTTRFPLITIMRAAAFPAAILFVSAGVNILAIPLAFALGATLSLVVSYHAASKLRLIDKRMMIASFTRIIIVIGVVVFRAML